MPVMNEDLRYHLTEGPHSVKNLKRLLGKSETWVRTQLKEFSSEIRCRKDSTGQNVFWIEETQDEPEATPEPVTEPEGTDTPSANETQPDEPEAEPTDCPACHSTNEQKIGGEEGTFLGACRICSDCGKTYNVITRKVINHTGSDDKAKRVILNPQHKIRAKTEAVGKAGGTLRFDKVDRRWVLGMKNGDTLSMTAEQFSIETPETLVEKMG